MKLKSIEDYTKNRSFIFPLVGKVTFDDNNTIEVSDENGKALLEMTMGVKLQAMDNISKVQQNELTEGESKVNFDNMTDAEVDELIALFPEDKTKDLNNKKKKIRFLEKNYN
jgi:hypothetical protein